MHTKVKQGIVYVAVVCGTLWAYDAINAWWERKSTELYKDITQREIASALKDVRLLCDKKPCTNAGEALTPEQALSALYVYKQRAESYESTLRTVSEMTMQ